MKPFQLLVKPVAADCNLECGYCFYRPVNDQFGGDGVRHRMDSGVLEELIRDYLSYRFEVSVICWQGGEPTLAGLDFFERVVELEMKHGRDGQVVGNALQTNGLLIDDDWAKFLAKYRFLVGLSLDGPEDVHNTYRNNRKGRGSFDKVMAAAEEMRRHGVAFNILAVVSKANQERAADVYGFFRDRGFNELQFIPCLERDPRTGEPSEFCVTPEGYAGFLVELFNAWMADDPAAVFIRTFDCFLNSAAGRPPDLCIFQERCGAYLLVEHNGDVYPCDFFVRPQWRLGNVADRPLERFFSLKRQREFARGKEKLDPSCLTCEWRPLCHGGCLKDRMDKRGKPARKSLLCSSYRRFFAHSIPALRRGAAPSKTRTGHEGDDAPRPQKIGRNDPCPCGSGLKYKKCCLSRES